MSSTSGVSKYSINISTSLKIQQLIGEIITIIKDMDTCLPNEDLKPLNRLLYRSMDSLTELKSELLVLKVSQLSKTTV